MKVWDLRQIAEQRAVFTPAERQWCIAELTGPLADCNPLPQPARATDAMLADCLLRAWITSTRCDCD